MELDQGRVEKSKKREVRKTVNHRILVTGRK